MEWINLPLLPNAPPGVKIRLKLDRGIALRDRPLLQIRERTTCELSIEGVEPDKKVRVWLGDRECTEALRRINNNLIYWPADWEDYAGFSCLRVEASGRIVLSLPVEIIASKLQEEDHHRLLEELTEWVAALVFGVATPAAFPTAVVASEKASPYLSYLLIRYLMAPHRLPGAFERVRMEPHRRLVREPRTVDFAQAREISAQGIVNLVASADLAKGENVLTFPIARLLRGHIPTRISETRPRTEFDTPENRFVAHLLRTLENLLNRLEQAFRNESMEQTPRAVLAQSLADECHRWAQEVSRMRKAPFLEEVGPMTVFPASSQVLRHREGYRELLEAYLWLTLSPRVRWQELEGILQLPARDVPTLYEYWGFFALVEALASLTGSSPDWHDLVHTEGNLWEIRLKRGVQTALPIGPATLWYNREFRNDSYSLPLRPDYAIKLGERLWLFDAKYRLEWADLLAALEGEELNREDREATFKRVDLYKMHTYRDAIREAEAVFILYPGTKFRAYGTDRRRYDDPEALPSDFQGVGAIPLRPGQTSALEAVVKAFGRHI